MLNGERDDPHPHYEPYFLNARECIEPDDQFWVTMKVIDDNQFSLHTSQKDECPPNES